MPELVLITPVTSNSYQMPLFHAIILQEVINLVTEQVMHKEQNNDWIPFSFITSGLTQSNNFDVDIKHFCAPVVHLITGETIPNYQK